MNAQNLLVTSASFKAEESTSNSTIDWREHWRVHGTSWRTLIELHFEICDRLRTSPLWEVSS
jgi:hypothetical protein